MSAQLFQCLLALALPFAVTMAAERGVLAGRVMNFDPGRQIEVKPADGDVPVQHKLARGCTVVDANGRTLTPKAIAKGAAVSLVLDESDVARPVVKVILMPVSRDATRREAVAGIVESFSSNGTVMNVKRSKGNAAPVPYRLTEGTVFIGHDGERIARTKVTAGDPVVIATEPAAAGLVARQVVVRTLKDLKVEVRGLPERGPVYVNEPVLSRP